MFLLVTVTWAQDWRWREEGGPEQKYSALQIMYFDTPPADRFRIIDELVGAARDHGSEIGDELSETTPANKVKVIEEIAEKKSSLVPEL